MLLGVNVKHSFEPRVLKLRALAQSGELGRLRMIHSWRYVDWLYRPRTRDELTPGWGAGILWRQGPHHFDFLRTIGGGMLRSVRGNCQILDPARRVTGAYTALSRIRRRARLHRRVQRLRPFQFARLRARLQRRRAARPAGTACARAAHARSACRRSLMGRATRPRTSAMAASETPCPTTASTVSERLAAQRATGRELRARRCAFLADRSRRRWRSRAMGDSAQRSRRRARRTARTAFIAPSRKARRCPPTGAGAKRRRKCWSRSSAPPKRTPRFTCTSDAVRRRLNAVDKRHPAARGSTAHDLIIRGSTCTDVQWPCWSTDAVNSSAEHDGNS